jgi:hypothetical protein
MMIGLRAVAIDDQPAWTFVRGRAIIFSRLIHMVVGFIFSTVFLRDSRGHLSSGQMRTRFWKVVKQLGLPGQRVKTRKRKEHFAE